MKNLKVDTLHNYLRREGRANLEGKTNSVKRILGQNLDEVNEILLGYLSDYRFKSLDVADRMPGIVYPNNQLDFEHREMSRFFA